MRMLVFVLWFIASIAAAGTVNERLDDGLPVSSTGITPSKGAVWAANGTAFAPLAPGTNNFVLTADSSQTLGVKWAAAGGGGANTQYAKKTSGYTVTSTDNLGLIDCDASGAPFTITLSAATAAGAGTTVIIRKIDSSANAVTITANGVDGINRGALGGSITLTTQLEWKRLVSTGVAGNGSGGGWIYGYSPANVSDAVGSLAAAKVAPGTAAQFLQSNGTPATNWATMSGDGTLSTTGALTVTKTGGVAFATSATTDATNAANITSGTLVVGRGGTGSGVGPTPGQLSIGNAGGTAYAPQTVSGDGTLTNLGVLTVTKTNGVNFAASATTDTTNATNISSGSLNITRVAPGTAAQFLQSNGTPATNWVTMSGDGTLSNTGALTVTKTGGVAFAPSATTDTTNAANISSGILPGARGGTNNGFMQFSGPATSLKTYALPNASDTIAVLGQPQTWTGAQSFNSGDLKLNGSGSGTITVQPVAAAGANTITIPAVTGNMVTTGDTGTVTNTMLAGGISNANLANSSITIQGSAVSLGGATLATNSNVQFQAIGLGGAAGSADTLKLYGTTSGSILLQPAAIAGANTITFPAATGNVVTTGDTGTVTNAMLAGSIDLTAKVTGALPPANGGTGSSSAPTSAQIPLGNAGGTAYAPQTISGDGTITNAGVLTITKTNGVSFAPSATTDTTNAANISSGTLPIARGGTNATTALNNNRVMVSSGGGITEIGTHLDDGMIIVGKTGAFGPQIVTLGGDATISNLGSLTVTKTNGSAFGTAATQNTGTSGATLPFLNGANTWSGTQSFTDASMILKGLTSGTSVLKAQATAGATTFTFPTTTGTLIGTGDSATVTNAMLAGSISNANLANSAITIQGASVSLGGSALATNSSPQFTAIGLGGAASGTADTIKFFGTTSGSITFAPIAIAGANTITLPAETGNVITTGGTGTVSNAMLAGSIDLTAKVTGTLPVTNGGTGVATLTTAYGVVCAGTTATGTLQNAGAGTSGNVLVSGGGSALPAYAALNLAGGANFVSGALPIGNGGTGQTTKAAAENALSPLTTKGDIQTFDGTNVARLGVGANGLTIVADSTQATGLKWAASTGNTATTPMVITGADVEFGTCQAPTTLDGNSSANVGSAGSGKKVAIFQTIVNNTQPAMEIQNSTGNYQWQLDNSITSNVDVKNTIRTSKQAACALQSITETLTLNTGSTTTNTVGNLIPANSFIVGVTYRVTTGITTAASFSVGDSVSSTRFGTGVAVALSTTGTSLIQTNPCSPFTNGTATTVLITTNVNPGAGAVEITVFYYTLTAPGQ